MTKTQFRSCDLVFRLQVLVLQQALWALLEFLKLVVVRQQEDLLQA